jgi:hypothetical protein
MNVASALSEMKKLTRVDKECKEAEKVVDCGMLKRSVLPVTLMRIKTFYQLQNWANFKQEAMKIDESTASLEKDFLLALYEYA